MSKHKLHRITFVAVIAFAALCAIVYALFFLVNPWTVNLKLRGDTHTVVEAGTPYEEAGAEASVRSDWLFSAGRTVPILVRGSVGDAPGEYVLRYSAGVPGHIVRAERTVTVQDTVPPALTLSGETEIIVRAGDEFLEPGYSAVDTVDGDLTGQVTVHVTEDGVDYRVTDSAGNTACASRIFRRLNEPPVITLLGDAAMERPAGLDGFEDPGYSARDSMDGDLTGQVSVTGFVNPYRAGEYTLTYTVTDSEGLTASTERIVTVTPAPPVTEIRPEGRVIYLTFDDGPSANTDRLLDILEQYGVKATWFVTARFPEYADRLTDIAARGHTVAIHTATHDYDAVYASEEAYFEDFCIVQNMILERTGEICTMFRFPGGSSNTVSFFNPGIMTALAQDAADCGLVYFDWNVSGADTAWNATRYTVLDNLIEGVSEHRVSVVLQHDTMDFSIDALTDFIPWAQERGFVFLPLESTSPTAHHDIMN